MQAKYSKGSIGNVVALAGLFLVLGAIWSTWSGDDVLKNTENTKEDKKEMVPPKETPTDIQNRTTFSYDRGNSVYDLESIRIKIKNKTLDVFLADTFEKRTQGLSGVSRMSDSKGMLFVFDNMDKHGFWMKDMNFPIDIIWFDENFRVVDIKENATPRSYPTVFTPSFNAKYVLETVSGFSRKNNLKLGDRFYFLP